MTNDQPIRSIAILGGGTAGWMAAAMLAKAFPGQDLSITVVESAEIGTVGVGEATIPPMIDLLRFLDIDEADFVQATQATYKLGIKFIDWREVGQSYWHPFGTFGASINRRPFVHAWHKAKAAGLRPRFNDFSACAALGDAGRFQFPHASDPLRSGLRYALHFDASRVATYLRAYAEHLGVTRLERTVTGAAQREDGFIDALLFTEGAPLAADLFLDCSGFRGLLIQQVLKTGYQDWSSLLPCDRAVAAPTANGPRRAPYTQSRARSAGWQWRIPLQHRAGNGYVYSSAHLSDQDALDDLEQTVGLPLLAEPRLLKFVTGRRNLFWNKNCIALGLASGFLEPLESTSIHLVMSGVYNLLEHFPDRSFEPSNIADYNNQLIAEMEHIRDFIVLHYCATQRTDADLWRDCQAMALPDSLSERIELYRQSGRVRTRPGELFTDLSWFYVFEGLGLTPLRHDPLIDVVPMPALRDLLGRLAVATDAALKAAPTHDSYFPTSQTTVSAVQSQFSA